MHELCLPICIDLFSGLRTHINGYDDPVLGKDPQDHMAKLWTKEGDHGGVHISSGIPSRVSTLEPPPWVTTLGRRSVRSMS